MNNFNIYSPTSIVFGNNKLDSLLFKIGDKYKNILVVGNKDLKTHLDKLIDVIDNISAYSYLFTFDNIEPTTSMIDEITESLTKKNFDLIIGLGGGSAIDMAKALAISLRNPEPIWNYANLSNRPPSKLANKPIPVVAIPTTSGTGSEVTPYAVLSKEDTKQKGTIQEDSIIPIFAIVDSNFLLTMPPELTAYTGVDAFAHAFESYINISKLSPFTELVSEKAMTLIFRHLPEAVKKGSNVKSRLKMAYASSLAGMAISHRGTTTTHAIAEPMGALTKLPHSVTVCLCTLPVLKHSYDHIKEKLDRLNKIIFLDYDNNYDFIENFEILINKIGCKKRS